ncbi:MAG: stage V sporulation protein B [Paenibacillus sp. RIFOXYA1_FULL_44_5]|nr:MAG: stage V sporulation protein B [Paenibacillus sp. RIFOXYA1_FULL_44_5]
MITGGIPLAVAKLVAESETTGNEKKIRAVLKVSLLFTLFFSIIFFIFCLVFANWIIARLYTDSRVYYTFLSMLSIIPLVGISAVYRGYFQGRQNMIPTAGSQIIETIVRIVTVILFAYWMLPYGIAYAAAGAMAGMAVGELGGLLALFMYFRAASRQTRFLHMPSIGALEKRGMWRTFRDMIKIAIPVTGSKLVGSISYLLESIFIVQSLAIAGIATKLATAQYGELQGMVIPVLLLPGALTTSLSIALVPSLSEAAAQHNMKLIHKRLHQSLRLALVTGAPFVVIMYVLAEPLCRYLFNEPDIAKMLRMMAPIAMFIYFQGPLNATLQALDRPGQALLNTFVGAAIKMLLIIQLASQPNLGILGAIIAINVNIMLVTVLHWHSIVRMLHFSMKWIDFIKVGAGALLMAAINYIVMNQQAIGSEPIRFLSSMAAGIMIYILSMVALKMIERDDLIRVPWIGKLFR